MGNSANNTVLSFGEVMLRLSPSDKRQLRQDNTLEYYFGGTELNVAASLAVLGEPTRYVSQVSDDFVGEAALASIRSYGIDAQYINKTKHPLGLYFLEVGSGMRPSRISYNRLHGAFSHIAPKAVNWKEALRGCSHLHWTGITPGISEGAYETLKAGLEQAKKQGITVSADPAYRSNLWKYGKEGDKILKELTGLSTIFIGGVNEINELLKTDFEFSKEGFIAASKALIKACPRIEKVFDKVRTGLSASWQKIYAHAWTGKAYLRTQELEISDVVDRIGTGDAYAAGVIYGLRHFDDQKTLEFANAACGIKHTILGDANLASVAEIEEVASGNTGGRIKR